jgi:hypothetical protein
VAMAPIVARFGNVSDWKSTADPGEP